MFGCGYSIPAMSSWVVSCAGTLSQPEFRGGGRPHGRSRNSRSLHCGRDDNSVAGLESFPVNLLRVQQNCHPDRRALLATTGVRLSSELTDPRGDETGLGLFPLLRKRP